MENLKKIYYDPSHPAGFGGAAALSKASGVSLKDVKAWLLSQATYTLHKPARKRYGTRKYKVSGIDHQWQADLVDMQKYADENEGYKYILTVIDMFSRYAWAKPVESKTARHIKAAFEEIFEDRKPFTLQTDQGMEFESNAMKAFWNEHDINQFSVKSQFKAAMVERFNRTLKKKMWTVFTHQASHEWLDLLPKLLEAYNNSVHRSIKLKPVDVNKDNETDLWLKQEQPGIIQKVRRTKIKVGDQVRLSKAKYVFDKGYEPNWTEEIFTVHSVLDTVPIQIKVQDYGGELVEGSFYLDEVQKVDKPEEYKVEKVIRTRKVRGKTQYFVKWKGYPDKFNSWVDNVRSLS